MNPSDEEDLAKAVATYKTRLTSEKPVVVGFDDIRKMLVNPLDRSCEKRFSVKVGQHLKLIAVDDIECFYSENKGTYAYTSNGRNYLLDVSLEQLEPDLEPHVCFRVSRKFYVNIEAIKDMISYTNSRIHIH